MSVLNFSMHPIIPLYHTCSSVEEIQASYSIHVRYDNVNVILDAVINFPRPYIRRYRVIISSINRIKPIFLHYIHIIGPTQPRLARR